MDSIQIGSFSKKVHTDEGVDFLGWDVLLS